MGGKNKARLVHRRLRQRRRTHRERGALLGAHKWGTQKELASIQTRYQRHDFVPSTNYY